MTMLSRIARAIHAGLSDTPPADADTAWKSLPQSEKARYLQTALRTLTIMRTPTDAMLIEGDRRDMAADAANVWERMIYRALYED